MRTFVGALLVVAASVGSTNTTRATTPDADRALAAWALAKFDGHAHQAVVVRDGAIVAAAADPPDSIASPQRVASISKMVTATAVLRLVEAGRLALDTPVFRILPELFVGTDASWSDLDVDDLLTHRSGLPTNTEKWFDDTWFSCRDAVVDQLTNATRATTYAYSNTNYCLLSLIVAAVTMKPYAAAVRSLVFAPLGIDDVWFDVAYLNLLGAGAWGISAPDVARLTCTIDPESPRTEFCPNGFLSDLSRRSLVGASTSEYGRGVMRWTTGAWGHSGTLDEARVLTLHLPDGTIGVLLSQYTMDREPPVASGTRLYPWVEAMVEAMVEANVRATGGTMGTPP